MKQIFQELLFLNRQHFDLAQCGQATGNRQQATGNRELATYASLKFVSGSFKNIFLILFTTLFLPFFSFCQTPAFNYIAAPVNMSTNQSNLVSYANSQPHVGPIQFIQWNNSNLYTNNSLNLLLPGLNGGQPITFTIESVFYPSGTEFSLIAHNQFGECNLFVSADAFGGHINYQNKSFTLFPFNPFTSILIENELSTLISNNCETEPINQQELGLNYCSGECGGAVIDVLVMIDESAKNWLLQFDGIFQQWYITYSINTINTAFQNSLISNKKVNFKIIEYTPKNVDYVPGMGIFLTNLTSDIQTYTKLDESGCDVGILITNYNFSIIGTSNATDQGLSGARKYAVVKIEHIGEKSYSFAHELAHHFLCRHDNDNSDPGCPHGKNLSNNTRHTIMAVGGEVPITEYSRILHFSNPDVNWIVTGESTGEIGYRNNAARIKKSFCIVSSIRNSTKFYGYLQLNSEICVEQPLIVDAIAYSGIQFLNGNDVFCQGPFYYQWEWSEFPDFSNTHLLNNNGPHLELNSPPSCPSFYLRVKVYNSSGCELFFSDYYKCTPCPQFHSISKSSKINEKINIFQDINSIKITGLSYSEIQEVIAFNPLGNPIKLNSKLVTNDEIEFDTKPLNNGIWFIYIKKVNNTETLVHRFYILE